MRHFHYYPTLEYNGELVTNIMVRGKIRDAIKNESYVYYTHKVSDSERPDIISSKYYGNASYTWAIFYANDIFDPLVQWPLTQYQFGEYILARYGSIEKAKLETHHYLLDETYIIDKFTFDDVNVPANQKRAVSIYEHETNLNEAKRDIKIIDVVYIRQLTNELSKLFK